MRSEIPDEEIRKLYPINDFLSQNFIVKTNPYNAFEYLKEAIRRTYKKNAVVSEK